MVRSRLPWSTLHSTTAFWTAGPAAGAADGTPAFPAHGPDDEQVGAHPAEAVLALDAAAAVHDALQERLQQQLRAGFPVLEPLDPVLGVLPKERLERRQQRRDLQAAVGTDVPGGGRGSPSSPGSCR